MKPAEHAIAVFVAAASAIGYGFVCGARHPIIAGIMTTLAVFLWLTLWGRV